MTGQTRRFRRMHFFVLLAVLLILVPLAACKKEAPPAEPAAAPAPAPAPAAAPAAPAAAPVTVVALGLGKSIGADKKVTAEADTFAKTDTIYAAVGTTGSAASAALEARWSFVSKAGEKSVKDDKQSIAPTGDATTEFHISKPDGWPAGDYKIEILLDGKSVATKAFRVAK
jgi:hypothetical protein